MKNRMISALAILLLTTTVTAQTDSTKVKNDSVTWSQSLDGVTIMAQRQLIKQDIDRVGYDVQADEESKTLTVLDMLRKVPMVTVDGEDNIKVKGGLFVKHCNFFSAITINIRNISYLCGVTHKRRYYGKVLRPESRPDF